MGEKKAEKYGITTEGRVAIATLYNTLDVGDMVLMKELAIQPSRLTD